MLALAFQWDVAMSSVIEVLLEEHKNIARLLNAMENQLEKLATANDPDLDLLQSIANYFCDYPDHCHHPKEIIGVWPVITFRSFDAWLWQLPFQTLQQCLASSRCAKSR